MSARQTIEQVTHFDGISLVPVMGVNFDFGVNGDEAYMSARVTSNSIRDEGPLRTCSSPGPSVCAQRGFVGSACGFAHVRRKSSKTCRKGWHGVLDHPHEPSDLPVRIVNACALKPRCQVPHLSMAVVYLPFLGACQRILVVRGIQKRTVESERIS